MSAFHRKTIELIMMKFGRGIPLDPGSDIGCLTTSNPKPLDCLGKPVTVTQFLMVAPIQGKHS